MIADSSDVVWEGIQVVRETIDRNKDRNWEEYRKTHKFTLLKDGKVRVAQPDEKNEGEHVVEIDRTGAVDCDCYIAMRPFGKKPCRHMRAVDAHPRL